MITEAIILAGGFGTRLQKVVNDVPKPMALVNGRPFLEYLIDYLIQFKIKRIILSTGYKHETISFHFGKTFKNIKIDYSHESKPLGTGGAILQAINQAKSENVLILNGDSIFRFDIDGFAQFHKQHNNFSVALRKISDTSRYGKVELTENSRISQFCEKSKDKGPGYINSGVYIFNSEIFKKLGLPTVFSIEKDFFQSYCSLLEIYGYVSDGYFIDIGIPKDYEKAQTGLYF
jgi:D-glycero-alpha-D-manno-heptose 1-phosphate guanylyltransferase